MYIYLFLYISTPVIAAEGGAHYWSEMYVGMYANTHADYISINTHTHTHTHI